MTRRDSGGSKRSGWDPLVIVSQIIAFQACHYLILALVIPPLLSLFADPHALSLEGGASNVAMIMDWREMVGRATIDQDEIAGDYMRLPASLGRHRLGWDQQRSSSASSSSSGGSLHGNGHVNPALASNDPAQQGELAEQLASSLRLTSSQSGSHRGQKGYIASDPVRGWLLGLAWMAASFIDVFYMYHLIRRPTYILDFSLTLVFNHTVLTTYYASAFPTSPFFWAIVGGSAAVQIIWAEQLCVRREMKEGFTLGQGWKTDEREEDLPMYQPNGRRQRRNSAPSAVGKYDRIPMSDLG